MAKQFVAYAYVDRDRTEVRSEADPDRAECARQLFARWPSLGKCSTCTASPSGRPVGGNIWTHRRADVMTGA